MKPTGVSRRERPGGLRHNIRPYVGSERKKCDSAHPHAAFTRRSSKGRLCTIKSVLAGASYAPIMFVDYFELSCYGLSRSLLKDHDGEPPMIEWSPNDVRREIRHLKSRIYDIEDTRIAPVDDRWHELLSADWEAARVYGVRSGRAAATHEIEGLWAEIDHLTDAWHGRRPRGVTFN
jgi:hypothetical protein